MLISHSEYNEDEDGHEVFVKKEEEQVVVKEEEMEDADFVDDFEVEDAATEPEPKVTFYIICVVHCFCFVC